MHIIECVIEGDAAEICFVTRPYSHQRSAGHGNGSEVVRVKNALGQEGQEGQEGQGERKGDRHSVSSKNAKY